jgi:hypothetical protein
LNHLPPDITSGQGLNGFQQADLSGREPGINVLAPRILKNKQSSPSIQFIFSAYLIDPPIIVLFSTFICASGHQFNYSRRADGPFIPPIVTFTTLM